MQFIDLKTQYQHLQEEIQEAIQRVLRHGNFILGPEVEELEQTLAHFVGVKHCISVASGTDALVIALRALGIGPGDEVITSPFTFFATAEAVALVGALPRFVDIEPATFNIDVEKIEQAITKHTKALLPVSLFGQMPDYGKINALTEAYGLPVIEDGAQSFGAMQRGKRSCGMTTIGATSFFPAKPLGGYGDGGAIFTSDDALAKKMRIIRVHGSEARNYHTEIGVTGRLDTLQAAILLAKFPTFPLEIEAREAIGRRYSELLGRCCQTPLIQAGNTHVFAQYTIRLHDRDFVAEKMSEQGIPTAVYYPLGLHEQPVFRYLGYKPGDFPEAEKAAKEVLSLPMHPWLTPEMQDSVVHALASALNDRLPLENSRKAATLPV